MSQTIHDLHIETSVITRALTYLRLIHSLQLHTPQKQKKKPNEIPPEI